MGIIKIKDLIFEYIRRDEEGNVEGITKAVDDVNLDIKQGDFVAILGHNGSGKSTLAKHMNAILYPSEGSVWVDGKDTQQEENIWDIRQTAGMVFQNPDNQIIGQIVEEDVGFGPENMGVETKEIWERVNESLKAVGMYEFRKFSPNKLSGGQKQRVSIAGVIAMHPKCIVLDEPTSFLDIRYKLEFMSVLQELARRKKVAVILSIHELDLAERVSDWVLCVSPGQESRFGRPEEMLTPEHLSELFQIEEAIQRVGYFDLEIVFAQKARETRGGALPSDRRQYGASASGGGARGICAGRRRKRARCLLAASESWNYVCGRDRIGSRLRLSGGLYIGVQIDCSPRI